jgi:hypothetical protein
MISNSLLLQFLLYLFLHNFCKKYKNFEEGTFIDCCKEYHKKEEEGVPKQNMLEFCFRNKNKKKPGAKPPFLNYKLYIKSPINLF